MTLDQGTDVAESTPELSTESLHFAPSGDRITGPTAPVPAHVMSEMAAGVPPIVHEPVAVPLKIGLAYVLLETVPDRSYVIRFLVTPSSLHRKKVAFESYQISPVTKVEGTPAYWPTLNPDTVAPGAKVCRVFPTT